MIEVEVRVRVKDFKFIREWIEKNGGKFLRTENQEDIVFGHDSFLNKNKMVVDGGFIARIRSVDGNILLEFKEIRRISGGVEISANLSNKEHGILLLEKLNFKEAFTVSKKKEVYSYCDFLICFDEVGELGNFVEIEKCVGDKSEKEKTRDDCVSLLNKIDKNLIIENKKYGDLIQEKKNETAKSDT